MTSPVPGWYPDPHDENLIRYWDGEAWTSHTAPAEVEGTASGADHASADGVEGQRQGSSPPASRVPSEVTRAAAENGGSSRHPEAERGASRPSVWETPAAGTTPSTWSAATAPPRTSDGEDIASPSRRIAAFCVDALVVSLPVSMLMSVLLPEGWAVTVDALSSRPRMHPHPYFLQYLAALGLAMGVVHYLYDWVLTSLKGTTLGRWLFGLWVRQSSDPAPPDWTTSGRRSLLKLLHAVTSPIPVVSLMTKLWLVVDATRMLTHPRHEAWHDALTSTVVVRRPVRRHVNGS